MRQVVDGIWIGGRFACAEHPFEGAILHAAAEPCHAMIVGQEALRDPTHPEYLVARRGDEMSLNLLDVDSPIYLPEALFTLGVAFIDAQRSLGRDVLVHCDDGLSRSSTLILLYLRMHTDWLDGLSFDDARARFEAHVPGATAGAAVKQTAKHLWPV